LFVLKQIDPAACLMEHVFSVRPCVCDPVLVESQDRLRASRGRCDELPFDRLSNWGAGDNETVVSGSARLPVANVCVFWPKLVKCGALGPRWNGFGDIDGAQGGDVGEVL
jgi:hypothetical protein